MFILDMEEGSGEAKPTFNVIPEILTANKKEIEDPFSMHLIKINMHLSLNISKNIW